MSKCLFLKAIPSRGFNQSKSDYSLFTKSDSQGFIALLLYVDDIIIANSSSLAIASLKSFLESQFKLKDLGSLKYFIGLEIARSKQGISLCQCKYILELLEEYGLTAVKPVSIQIKVNHKLIHHSENLLENPTSYRQLVGKLLYLTLTRPDITYAVHVLTQFMDKPAEIHFRAALRVLKYLKGSPGQGLLFYSTSTLHLSAYCDSDWAGCLETRRSLTGYCIFLGTSLISWKSKKQQVVSRSSTGAEYRSMATTAAEVTWLLFLLSDFKISTSFPVELFCDNVSALHICNNPKVQLGVIKPQYISTAQQLTDIFTKALSTSMFYNLLHKMSIINIYAPLEGEYKK
ncbi:uncharacterized mitochondrial protein AtMg00810-like [Mercurialis annua]|uniref:uncharacterized mitochondrial protein AtMg00810-like n=1 Tax=Mercurialis annua TaxID=3986 RepID=UPI00215F3F83|nr:uncharacterized mitochondrial protein AtMg00810-like [Mercurialis annua]